MIWREVKARDVQVGDVFANRGTVTAVLRRSDGATNWDGSPLPAGWVWIECGTSFSSTGKGTRPVVVGRPSDLPDVHHRPDRPAGGGDMDAVITIDPARQGGAPCVGDTRATVEAVVASVIYDGVAETCDAFGLTAREVRLACAWWALEALDGDRAPAMQIPKGWERWARRAWRNHADPTDPPEVLP